VIGRITYWSVPNRRRLYLKCDGARAETRFRLSAKRTSPFKSAGASFQSTTWPQDRFGQVRKISPPPGFDPRTVQPVASPRPFALWILVGKPEGKRPLGRPRRRWEDNIKMELKDEELGVDWIELAQDRDRWRALVNAVMNLRVL